MTAGLQAMDRPGGLPPLGSAALWSYRILWLAFALGALAAHASLLTQPAVEPVILVLRLVKAALIFAVATILFRKRQRDPVAALLCLALLCWTITSSSDFSSTVIHLAVLDRIRFLLFALALLLFPDGEWRPSWGRHVAVASVAVTAIGIFESVDLLPTRLFLPLAILCVLAAVVALIHCFRTAATEVLRQQMKWVALCLVAGIALILSARAGAALTPGAPLRVLWEALFQTGIVAIAGGFLISLLRYRLFDAEAAISRSAAYAGLTVAVIAIFAATEATIETAGQMYLGMGLGNVSAGAAAAVAAVLLKPIHDRISSWAEERFQRDLTALKSELPALIRDLAVTAAPRELGSVVLPRICDAIHATHAALLVNGSIVAVERLDHDTAERWARASPFEDSAGDPFPVRLAMDGPSGSMGCLLLGHRPDGSLYGKDDLGAVEAIIPALRHALIMNMAREKDRDDERRRHRRFIRRIQNMQTRVRALEAFAAGAHSHAG